MKYPFNSIDWSTSGQFIYLFLNLIVYFYSICCMFCHRLGRTGVPCPPLCVSSRLLFLLYLSIFLRFMCVCGRWGCGVGVGRGVGGGIFWCDCVWGSCSYLNRSSPELYALCGFLFYIAMILWYVVVVGYTIKAESKSNLLFQTTGCYHRLYGNYPTKG